MTKTDLEVLCKNLELANINQQEEPMKLVKKALKRYARKNEKKLCQLKTEAVKAEYDEILKMSWNMIVGSVSVFSVLFTVAQMMVDKNVLIFCGGIIAVAISTELIYFRYWISRYKVVGKWRQPILKEISKMVKRAK